MELSDDFDSNDFDIDASYNSQSTSPLRKKNLLLSEKSFSESDSDSDINRLDVHNVEAKDISMNQDFVDTPLNIKWSIRRYASNYCKRVRNICTSMWHSIFNNNRGNEMIGNACQSFDSTGQMIVFPEQLISSL